MNILPSVRFSFPSIFIICLAATLSLVESKVLLSQHDLVGQKAPAISADHWVTDGDGNFPHVETLSEGKVYMVEFWATWCGPCMGQIPGIAELQAEFPEQLQVISVTNEPPETVREFMSLQYDRTSPETFGDFLNQYSVVADPDQSIANDWLKYGPGSIPFAFVVGKTGEIEIADHPVVIQSVIGKIIDGTWDRDAYYARQKKRQGLDRRVSLAIRESRLEDAFDLSRGLEDLYEDDEKVELRFRRSLIAMRVNSEEGNAFFKESLERFKDEEGADAALVWAVVEMKRGDENPSKEILDISENWLKKKIPDMPESSEEDRAMKAATIDILAALLFEREKVDEAIELQQQAVKLSDDPSFAAFLRQMQQSKSSATEE